MRGRPGRVLMSVLGPLVCLTVWELGSRGALWNPMLFPPPTEIVARLPQVLEKTNVLDDSGLTLTRVAYTIAISIITGVLLGLLMGGMKWVRTLFELPLALLYPIPTLLLLPIITNLLGRGTPTVVFAASIIPVIMVTVATSLGVDQLSPLLKEAGRVYGAAGSWCFLRRVLLPGALPSIVSGIRVALGVTLATVIGLEMVLAQDGIGAFLWYQWQVLRVKDMYLALLAIGVFAFVISRGFESASDKLMPWRQELER